MVFTTCCCIVEYRQVQAYGETTVEGEREERVTVENRRINSERKPGGSVQGTIRSVTYNWVWYNVVVYPEIVVCHCLVAGERKYRLERKDGQTYFCSPFGFYCCFNKDTTTLNYGTQNIVITSDITLAIIHWITWCQSWSLRARSGMNSSWLNNDILRVVFHIQPNFRILLDLCQHGRATVASVQNFRRCLDKLTVGSVRCGDTLVRDFERNRLEGYYHLSNEVVRTCNLWAS